MNLVLSIFSPQYVNTYDEFASRLQIAEMLSTVKWWRHGYQDLHELGP